MRPFTYKSLLTKWLVVHPYLITLEFPRVCVCVFVFIEEALVKRKINLKKIRPRIFEIPWQPNTGKRELGDSSSIFR